MLLRDIRYMFNLGEFDPINQMIPLSGAHCNRVIALGQRESDNFNQMIRNGKE